MQLQSQTLTPQPSSSARAEHSLSQEIPHHAPNLLGSSRHRRERVRGSSATGTRGRAMDRGWGAGVRVEDAAGEGERVVSKMDLKQRIERPDKERVETEVINKERRV